MSEKKNNFLPYFIIVVAALGYFVDIYDLILFNVVKKESLEVIMQGATAEQIKSKGIFLFNMQMLGMLVGGLLWGVWGDKKGRISVLFGSILLYSAANLANAFVTNVDYYAIIRIIAGIGLAGELGAGITLVSETMSKEKRGYGTMIIVSFGALGAVAAALVGSNGEVIGQWLGSIFNTTFANWQVAYILGGIMGLLLLLLRVGTMESGMFKHIENAEVSKGDITILFSSWARFMKYLRCILIGLPIWFIIGLIIANSEMIWAKELGVTGKVVNGDALMYGYLGLCVGDVISGLLSQLWRSRRKVVMTYIVFAIALCVYYFFFARGISPSMFYLLSFLLGIATGFWALFVTIAAEQFGTNIRSTVTNTAPNFVRGSVGLITGLFYWMVTSLGVSNVASGFIVGMICLGLSFWAIFKSDETFGKDLDYTEQP